jgi:hypothetical protein
MHDGEVKNGMKIVWRSGKVVILAAVLMVVVIGTAAAVVALFTHTFPSVTVPGLSFTPLITSPCTSIVLQSNPAAAVGTIAFTCLQPLTFASPTLSVGAVAVAVSSTGGIPAGYTDLYAIPITTTIGTTCAATTGSVVLLSTNPTPGSELSITVSPATSGVGLSANTDYYYCADYSNTSASSLALATFTVTWQQ